MGTSYGWLHFASLDSVEDVKAALDRCREVAASLGYTVTRGPNAGRRGNLAALLVAIAEGEVVVERKGEGE